MVAHGNGSGAPGAAAELRRRTVGDFVLEHEIGRGGMGIVWLATQRSMARRVALKVLPAFATLDEAAVTRFRREAEATGRLAHPGIVPVYGLGEADGVQFFAMEFIDGPALAVLLDRLALRQASKLHSALVVEAQVGDRYPAMREAAGGVGNAYVRSCARLCAEVGNALAAAHRAGVIHRDLKPSNILIHPAGRPVLVDFGLARDEHALGLTRSGEQVGTPAYMAPEQARGIRQIDARVDVYGLGAVLYELLTLRPPFDGTTAAEVTTRILEEEPIPVRRLNPNVPVDLAAIVHRCLAKAAEARYPAMEALEHDLHEFLAGRPVHAELPGPSARLQAVLQRNRRGLWITALTVVATTAIAFLAGIVDDRGDVRNGYLALAEAERLLVEDGDAARARDLYERAIALTKDPAGVRRQRLADFRRAVASHYGRGPDARAALQRFAAVFDADERAQVQADLDRLEGRGAIRLASRGAELRTGALAIRAANADGLAAEWQLYRAGAPLPAGEYLLRATAHDGAVAVQWARVQIDAETAVEPGYLAPGALPDGFAPIVDPRTGQLGGAACTEVTRGEWLRWLRGLGDAGLRTEMTPLDWDGGNGDPDVAVRGLSFHQARAFAQAHGGHLPTLREHWLAASAGLQQLQLPWGGGFDPKRIAADPFQLDGPEPVRSRPDGASPLGVLHALGNVAEIASVGHDGRLRMAGGSYLDEARDLRLYGDTGSVPSTVLADTVTQHPGAGMRLYRFVAAADQPLSAKAADRRRDELRAAEPGAQLHDWRLRRDGRIDYLVEVCGRFDGYDRRRRLDLATPGYLLEGVAVRDGHGTEMAASFDPAPAGESGVLTIELSSGLRAGQGWRSFVSGRLEPVGGLTADRDTFVLRLPMQRGLQVQQDHRLVLPAGFRVDDVTPPPVQWTEQGATVLAWEPTADGRIETAVVRFRCDGGLGPLPLRGPAVERVTAFLIQWNGQQPGLDGLLAPVFAHEPRRGDQLRLQAVHDVTRIGAIETVECSVEWTMRGRDGAAVVLAGWPMWFQVRQDAAGARFVRLSQCSQVDQGRFEGADYVHAGLRVQVAAVPGAVPARGQDLACELQLQLRGAAATAQVVGHMAAPEASLASIRFRLSGGDSVLRPGWLLGSEETPQGLVQHWSFAAPGCATRERWHLLQRGRRHLLVRCSVTGADAAGVERSFALPDVQRWFETVLAAVRID